MYTFSNENVYQSKKRAFWDAVKECVLFLCEVLMAFLPIALIALILTLTLNETFNIYDFILDGELIWFSVTSLILLNLKQLFFNNKPSRNIKLINFLTLILLLVYNGTYIFLKLNSLKVFTVALNKEAILFWVMACLITTTLINLATILVGGGNKT